MEVCHSSRFSVDKIRVYYSGILEHAFKSSLVLCDLLVNLHLYPWEPLESEYQTNSPGANSPDLQLLRYFNCLRSVLLYSPSSLSGTIKCCYFERSLVLPTYVLLAHCDHYVIVVWVFEFAVHAEVGLLHAEICLFDTHLPDTLSVMWLEG